MKSKSTSSAPKEIIKDARKQGRRDGKNQVPRQEWEHNSVPYLMQLQRQYAASDHAHLKMKLLILHFQVKN